MIKKLLAMKASNSSRIHTADDGQLRRSGLSLRLTNPFYLVAALWLLILFLYCLSWSNLCVALDPPLVVFVCALICSFLVLGFHFQDQLGIQYSDASTVHGMEITSAIVCIVLVAGMVYNSNVPLISVLEGKPYNSMCASVAMNIETLLASVRQINLKIYPRLKDWLKAENDVTGFSEREEYGS